MYLNNILNLSILDAEPFIKEVASLKPSTIAAYRIEKFMTLESGVKGSALLILHAYIQKKAAQENLKYTSIIRKLVRNEKYQSELLHFVENKVNSTGTLRIPRNRGSSSRELQR